MKARTVNQEGYLLHNHSFHQKHESHSKKIFYIISQIIESIEIIDICTVDKYKYDLIIYHKENKRQYKVELENRSKKHFDNLWDKKYNSLDIPERKKHYNNESDIYIVTCNDDLSRFIVIKDFQKILNLNLSIYSKYNRYSNAYEKFIRIPYKYVKTFDMKRQLSEKQKEKYSQIIKKNKA